MEEAFRKAEEAKSKQSGIVEDNTTGIDILRAAYKGVGANFFGTVIKPYYGAGKVIQIPVFGHVKSDWVSLYPRLMDQTVNDRANILGGFTDGMKIWENGINPAYSHYLRVMGHTLDEMSTSVYSPASGLFVFGICLLSEPSEEKRRELRELVKVQYEYVYHCQVMNLPQTRLVVATWL